MGVSRSQRGFKLFVIFFSMSLWLNAGVRREIENWYVHNYENKALFLKIPIRGRRQIVHVSETRPTLDPGSAASPLLFKVGDQVRITDVNFRNDSVRFKIASLETNGQGEIAFQFPRQLEQDFPQRGNFDVALEATLTEGLSYTDIDSAKEEFIKSQFDQFVQQLARSNNTSNDFVVTTLGEKIPAYQLTKNKLQEVEKTLLEETTARKQIESDLARLRAELDPTKTQLSTLQSERDGLLTKIKSAERQTDEFRKSVRHYEQQIESLVKNLNLKISSATSLSAQVKILNESINTLQQERISRARELQDATTQLAQYQGRNQKLSEELQKAKKEKDKVWEDLRLLTSNRKSLEARYLAIKQENEKFQDTSLLANSLYLKRRVERREEGLFQLADLYLLSQLIATLEIQVPPYAGTVHPVRFEVKSPEIVKFTEEEREIYEVLGETLKIQTSWESNSEDLKIVLLDKEPLQTVGPREKIEWPWMFQGDISQPEQVSLVTHLISPDGTEIFLGSQDFTVSPGQMFARLRHSFSLISLLAGVVLALAALGLVFTFRRNPQPPEGEEAPDPVVQKRL
ncbi:MAG: hypothetical protein IH790_01075 [Acidobacteria bacterium]|nr:hypothetical protein [Acidobacteriota bacterium]